MARKKKPQGHYCHVCGRYRANEKFGGKGHARHVCKDCAREQKAAARQRRRERMAEERAAQGHEQETEAPTQPDQPVE
jgi:ribosome-binding protein aMBF1 (putative translation factor)